MSWPSMWPIVTPSLSYQMSCINQVLNELQWLIVNLKVGHQTEASFTKEVNRWLAKRPLAFNGRLANHGLTS